MAYTIEVGDALEVLREMPDGVVQCCVTSPPYWGLRDYGVEGQLGLEKTPEEYVSKLVAIFSEVRRVLRDDGVLWLNLGDSYASDVKGSGGMGRSTLGAASGGHAISPEGIARSQVRQQIKVRRLSHGLKPKDLVGIPWMVAFALRADGWYLRSDVIWHKPNPMPESIRGRPTKSHEYVFLLSKSKQYFFDDEAIAEDAVTDKPGPKERKTAGMAAQAADAQHLQTRPVGRICGTPVPGKRHVRSVWTVPTVGYREAHFAAMSPELARRLVASGSSERGACAGCGAPWRRVLKRTKAVIEKSERTQGMVDDGLRTRSGGTQVEPPKMETLGWEPSCECGVTETQPCLVLDPFNGAGTTGLAAVEFGSDYVGIELNPSYAEMARRRIDAALGLSNIERFG